MGIIIRQGIKGTIANYIGIAFGIFNMLYLFPKVLTEIEIGLIRTLLDFSLVFASICLLGGRETMTKYFPYFKSHGRNKGGFYFFSILIPLLGFFIFSLAFFLKKDLLFRIYEANSPLLNIYTQYLYPLTFIALFSFYFESLSYLFGKITIPKIIREVFLRAFTGLMVIAYLFKYLDQKELIQTIVGVHLICLLFFSWNAWKVSNWSFIPEKKLFTRKFNRGLLSFMTYSIFGSLSGIIVSKIDTLMLSASKGLGDTGIYSIAFFIAIFVETPRRSLDAVSSPIIAESLSNGDMDHVREINSKSAINLLIASGFLFLIIFINLENLFSFMPNGEIYRKGRNVIFFVGIAKVFEAVSGMNYPIISLSHLYRYSTLILFMYSIIGVSLNALLIPLMGIDGAAIATLCTILIVHTFMHVLVYLKFKIFNLNKEIIIILMMLFSLFILNHFIPEFPHFFLDGIIRTVILSLIFSIVVFYSGVSSDLNRVILTMLDKIRNGVF